MNEQYQKTYNSLEKVINQIEGKIYLEDIVLSPLGSNFDIDIADFAILFMRAQRHVKETEQTYPITQLMFCFKGTEKLDLSSGKKVDADGVLEFIDYAIWDNKFKLEIRKDKHLYSIYYIIKNDSENIEEELDLCVKV